MKQLCLVLVAVLLASLATVPPARATLIWSDGFETNDLSAWTSADGQWKTTESTVAAHSGDIGVEIIGPN